MLTRLSDDCSKRDTRTFIENSCLAHCTLTRPSSRMYIATASYGCVSAVDAAVTDRMSSPWLFGARPQSSRMSIATAVTPLGRVWQQGVTVAAIDLVQEAQLFLICEFLDCDKDVLRFVGVSKAARLSISVLHGTAGAVYALPGAALPAALTGPCPSVSAAILLSRASNWASWRLWVSRSSRCCAASLSLASACCRW